MHLAAPVEVLLPKDWFVGWYGWTGPHQLVIQHGVDVTEGGLARYDVATGKSTAVPLDKRVVRGIPLPGGTYPWRVSPDGRWLLGDEVVQGLNRTRLVARRNLGYGGRRWTPGSRGWVEWEPQNPNSPTPGATVARMGYLPKGNGASARRGPAYVISGDWDIVGFVDPGKTVLMTGQLWAGTDDVRAGLAHLQRSTHAIRGFTVRIPDFRRLLDADISPDLKRVSWAVLCARDPRAPHDGPDGPLDASIWTSTVDGRDLRCIAVWPVPAFGTQRQPPDMRQVPQYLQWVPDGRRVSFLRDGRIWTVTVP